MTIHSPVSKVKYVISELRGDLETFCIGVESIDGIFRVWPEKV